VLVFCAACVSVCRTKLKQTAVDSDLLEQCFLMCAVCVCRTKLKQTEVDCELLKRCCETLTEENKRLQKELQELRAIKVAAPHVIAHDFYMPLPAATLTMCPSCERVATVDNRSVTTFAKKPGYSHF
jgi:hypothetical protein